MIRITGPWWENRSARERRVIVNLAVLAATRQFDRYVVALIALSQADSDSEPQVAGNHLYALGVGGPHAQRQA